ncbi:pre-toxin TG domain-containing protein [Bacillus sp. REN3]|uniref:pre-toxin TG domain-containing protein n=1 Tax=Bacillus sp. REN3 TaxID=2802440 RepID=UPI001AEE3F23|nr:pre-toxin TG domain-containing protein [Bacillus sp. REN3]
MSRVQIKVDELEAFAKQIVKAEQECDHALRAINLHFNSLLANFPGAVPGHIHNLEADFKYSVKRYKSKLDDAQRLIKLTAAKMAEADRKMSGKAGNFLLELLGWYDLLRLTGEYDPVTGEKLSAGDKTLAAIMLGLSIFPPAKVVGVGGKVAVAGTKAGKAGSKVDFPMFAKDPKVFMSIKNVLDTGKVRQAFKKVYDDVVVGPLAATKVWFDNVVKKIGDLPIPMNLQVQLAGVGAYRTTVREAFQEAKEQISRIVVGKGDEVGKGAHKNVPSGARYGERKISDETYAKLRRASPSSKIQREINKNIDDIIGTEDFALPGKTIDKKLHADHIVSLEKIARLEGFETLTYNQQKEIANFVENFIGLSEAANTSKGSKSFAEWYIYKKENIMVNPIFREKMILKERELEIEIQKMIDEFNKVHKKE